MPKYIAFVLGLLLIAAGSVAVWQGYDIIQVERGWTQVIAGATAFSAGVVTLAIGLLIGEVRNLRRDLADNEPLATPAMMAEPAADASPPPPFVARPAAPPVVEAEPVGNAALAEVKRKIALVTPRVEPVAMDLDVDFGPAPPPPNAEAAERSGTWIDEALAQTSPAAWTPPPLEGEAAHEPPASEPMPEAAAPHEFPPEEAAPEPKLAGVVGRYNFGGANYVLYEDGSIDAETSEGVQRFASLSELRAHNARSSASAD